MYHGDGHARRVARSATVKARAHARCQMRVMRHKLHTEVVAAARIACIACHSERSPAATAHRSSHWRTASDATSRSPPPPAARACAIGSVTPLSAPCFWSRRSSARPGVAAGAECSGSRAARSRADARAALSSGWSSHTSPVAPVARTTSRGRAFSASTARASSTGRGRRRRRPRRLDHREQPREPAVRARSSTVGPPSSTPSERQTSTTSHGARSVESSEKSCAYPCCWFRVSSPLPQSM